MSKIATELSQEELFQRTFAHLQRQGIKCAEKGMPQAAFQFFENGRDLAFRFNSGDIIFYSDNSYGEPEVRKPENN